MNKLLLILALIFVPGAVFTEDAPMNGWTQGEFGTYFTLKGKRFWFGQYPQTWYEQDGYAIVSGRKLHYWLYDSYTYHDGDVSIIYNRVIPSWVEKMGYVIDYDNIQKINPNPNLASSVKALMTQRGCDVSLTLVTKDLGAGSYDYVIINEYSKSKGIYWSTVYPLYK